MLDASIVKSAADRVISTSSIWIAPEYFAKRPRTFETTMWRTEKWMPVWAVSMFQVVVLMVGSSVVTVR